MSHLHFFWISFDGDKACKYVLFGFVEGKKKILLDFDRFLLFLCFLKTSLAEIVLEHDIFPFCRVKNDNLHDIVQQ